jgi:IS30 family transposase
MSKKNYPKWTKEEDHQLRVAVKKGTPARVIAKEMGRTPNAVYGRKHVLGIINGRGVNAPNVWTKKEINALKKMVKANTPNPVIAKELGRTPTAVGYRKAKLGLRNPKNKGKYAMQKGQKSQKVQAKTKQGSKVKLSKKQVETLSLSHILKTAKKAGSKVTITFE